MKIRINHITPNYLYLPAKVNSIDVKLVLDTGSAVSILNKSIFEKLGIAETQLGAFGVELIAADGKPIPVLGKFKLQLLLDCCAITHDFVIADIGEMEGIIGMDLLETYSASIDIANAEIKISDHSIKLEKENSRLCAFVRTVSKERIPPFLNEFLKGR